VELFIASFLFINIIKKPERLSTGPSAGFEVEKTRGVRTKSCKGLQSGLPERLPLCDSMLRHFFALIFIQKTFDKTLKPVKIKLKSD
jgi:hypothetical protein